MSDIRSIGRILWRHTDTAEVDTFKSDPRIYWTEHWSACDEPLMLLRVGDQFFLSFDRYGFDDIGPFDSFDEAAQVAETMVLLNEFSFKKQA